MPFQCSIGETESQPNRELNALVQQRHMMGNMHLGTNTAEMLGRVHHSHDVDPHGSKNTNAVSFTLLIAERGVHINLPRVKSQSPHEMINMIILINVLGGTIRCSHQDHLEAFHNKRGCGVTVSSVVRQIEGITTPGVLQTTPVCMTNLELPQILISWVKSIGY